MQLETVNKLFLELSQIVTAQTAREIELLKLLQQKIDSIDRLWEAINSDPELQKRVFERLHHFAAVRAERDRTTPAPASRAL